MTTRDRTKALAVEPFGGSARADRGLRHSGVKGRDLCADERAEALHRALAEHEISVDDLPRDSGSEAYWNEGVRQVARVDALCAAETGLLAPFESVRKLAVSSLLTASATQQNQATSRRDLTHLIDLALADASPAIRVHAAQIAIKLRVGGDEERTLRRLLESPCFEARLIAFDVLKAHQDRSWVNDVLIDLLDDADPWLRTEAFFLLSGCSDELGIKHVVLALTGTHPDVKLLAIDDVSKRHSNVRLRLLGRALKDEDVGVRHAAMSALKRDTESSVLKRALDLPHEDIRIQAACALAEAGDRAAFEPLIASATRPEPPSPREREGWIQSVCASLQGLARLGDARALDVALELFHHSAPAIRASAVWASAWLCDADDDRHHRRLIAAVRESSDSVRSEAALALAVLGHEAALPVLSTLRFPNTNAALRALHACVPFAASAPHLIARIAEHPAIRVRTHALLIALCLEVARHPRSVSPLPPRSELRAPGRVGRYVSGHPAFRDLVEQLLDHEHSGGHPFDFEVATTLATLIGFAPPRLRVRAAGLCLHLDEGNPDVFTQVWHKFFERFEGEIRQTLEAERSASAQGPFGAWVDSEFASGTARVVLSDDTQAPPNQGSHAIGQVPAPAQPEPTTVARGTTAASTSMVVEKTRLPRPGLARVDEHGVVRPIGIHAKEQLTRLPGDYATLPTPEGFVLLKRIAAAGQSDRVARLAGEITAEGHVCDIISFLSQSGWRGELIVIEGTHRRSLYFDCGNVVGAETSAPAERIGHVMFRFGALSAEQLRQVEQSRNVGRRFGWTAVKLGLVSQDELYNMIGKQIRSVVFGTFHVKTGTYFFLEDFDEEKLASRHTFGAGALLMEGLAQLDESRLYREKVPSAQHIPHHTNKERPPEPFEELYDAIDGRRSIEEIGRVLGCGEFHATKQIYELVKSKHVVLKSPPETQSPATTIASANAVLTIIFRRIEAEGKTDLLRAALAEWVATSPYSALFQNLGPDDRGLIDHGKLERNLEHVETDRDPTAYLQDGLHELVSAALFTAGGELGPPQDRELLQEVKQLLRLLRPRIAPDSYPPA